MLITFSCLDYKKCIDCVGFFGYASLKIFLKFVEFIGSYQMAHRCDNVVLLVLSWEERIGHWSD